VRLAPLPSPELRVFCFHCAGGNAYAYGPWVAMMRPGVEVIGVQLPGRGSRVLDPPLRRMEAMVEGLVPALLPLIDRPYVFFGHSMGALLCFEVVRRLARTGCRLPGKLFVCAAGAPGTKGTDKDLARLPEKEFLEEIRLLGGTPDEFFSNPEWVQLALPALRADIEAVETHAYGEIAPLDVPIAAFGGLDDDTVPLENLIAWRGMTRSSFTVHLFCGNHFLIESNGEQLVGLMGTRREPSPTPLRASRG
jgi:medium-chain acyl-[acyl-carrier-protein] hydrolase